MVHQSLPIALSLAALGGFCNVIATVTLVYPKTKAERGEQPWSSCALRSALIANIFFQFLNSAANVVASWFAPISIVIPTVVACQLLFNMVLFGSILSTERFPKDLRVGTFFVALAVILLPIVGPKSQENQDILLLLLRPKSMVWMAILCIVMIVSFVAMVWTNSFKRKSETADQENRSALNFASSDGEDRGKKFSTTAFMSNMLCQSTAGVLGASTSKMFVMVDGVVLAITIGVFVVTRVMHMVSIVYQANTVSQSKFVPMSVACTIICNAITGILIWEDWLTVQSYVGYAVIILQIILGIYLVSELDIFNDDEMESNSIQLQNAIVHNKRASLRSSIVFSKRESIMILQGLESYLIEDAYEESDAHENLLPHTWT